MKKTLVAVAALIATGAFAEVSITGFIDQAYNTTTTTTSAGAKSTVRSIGSNAIGQDSIGFAVSEDLGNGITAFGALNLITNVTTGSGAVNGDNGSGVGLKGAFGTLGFGQGYSLVWKTTAASDASGWGTGVGNAHGVGAGGNGSNGFGYTLPEIVPGLGLSIERAQGEGTSSAGNYSGMNISYTTGALMASYSTGSAMSTGTAVAAATAAVPGTSAAIPGALGEFTSIPAVGSVAATTEAVTALVKSNITALAVTYDLGMAKLHFGTNTLKSGGDADQKQSSSTFGVTVPMGATSIGLASSSAKYVGQAGTAAATTNLSGIRLLAKYALSKRTNAYFQWGQLTASGASTAKASGNGIGLTHSF